MLAPNAYKGGRSERIAVRCTPKIRKMLQQMTDRGGDGVTLSDVINDLVIEGYRSRFGRDALNEILAEGGED